MVKTLLAVLTVVLILAITASLRVLLMPIRSLRALGRKRLAAA